MAQGMHGRGAGVGVGAVIEGTPIQRWANALTAWKAGDVIGPMPKLQDYAQPQEVPLPAPAPRTRPAGLTGPICGALNRKGQPCRRRDLAANGRCRLHGGASTGPRTAGGKARARANLRRGTEKPPPPMGFGVD